MKKNKLIIIVGIVLVIIISLFVLFKNNKYSYKWVDEKESTINQSRLYVVDKFGRHIDGKVTITYLNGKSEEVEISKNGELYVKDIIIEVKNPRR